MVCSRCSSLLLCSSERTCRPWRGAAAEALERSRGCAFFEAPGLKRHRGGSEYHTAPRPGCGGLSVYGPHNNLLLSKVVLVWLALQSTNGQGVAVNFCWRAAHDASYRALTWPADAMVTVTEVHVTEGVCVHLHNPGRLAALTGKLTLRHADGTSTACVLQR